MRTSRALVPFLLTAAVALTACGGGDDGDDGSGDGGSSGAGSGATASESAAAEVEACDLLSPADVEAAVGVPVHEGVPSSGPSATGGGYTSCIWQSADPESVGNSATLTVYDNTAAADSAREDDAVDVEGIGDAAYSGSVSSVWVYVGDRSFFAQWYVFGTFDDEGLAQSEALAEAAADALS